MAELFNVVFAGELVGRADPATVRVNVGKLFGASEAVLDKLFSGQPVAIKKGIDRAAAMQLRARMKQAGAETRLVQVDEQGRPLAAPAAAGAPGVSTGAVSPAMTAAPASATAAAPSQARPVAAPAPEVAAAPAGSMAARLAAQAQALPAAPSATSAASGASAAGPATAVAPPPGDWGVKPVGTRLSDPLPSPPPAPDVSGISLATASGNLVSPQELARPAPVQVDVSGISLAAAGTEVLAESERRRVTPVQVDISAMSMAEVGAPLDEIREDKPLLNPDISHLSLAE